MNIIELERRYSDINERIGEGVYLYGAGNNGCWVYDYCKQKGILVHAFIDSDREKQGTIINGLKVVSCEQAMSCDAIVLVTSKHYAKDICLSLWEKCLIMSFDAYFVLDNKSEYEKLIFADDKSYDVLKGICNAMLYSDNDYLHTIAELNQYFCVTPFFNIGSETYVDFGAYVGDTVERFISTQNGVFNSIYAFEPAKKQMYAMQNRVNRLAEEWALDLSKIMIVNAGIGLKKEKLFISTKNAMIQTQLSREKVEDCEVIEIETIDNYFKNIHVTMMKFDIEGFEVEALLGGINILKRDKPKLAISVYHRPDDLLKIYKFIDNLNLNYQFKLRHHSSLLMDTTLYCY